MVFDRLHLYEDDQEWDIGILYYISDRSSHQNLSSFAPFVIYEKVGISSIF